MVEALKDSEDADEAATPELNSREVVGVGATEGDAGVFKLDDDVRETSVVSDALEEVRVMLALGRVNDGVLIVGSGLTTLSDDGLTVVAGSSSVTVTVAGLGESVTVAVPSTVFITVT